MAAVSLDVRLCTDFSVVKFSTRHQRQLSDTERVVPSRRFDTCTRNVYSVSSYSLLITHTPFTRYNRLSKGSYNRFDNRLYTTGCQTGLTTGCIV